jgi:indolepyruvate ferredoxin oxidoreductase beta subunit
MNAATIDIRPITIAVLALGGEGGGVLADWIVDVAQHAGYLAQATSVPGVAQRTGATVYYVELFPKSAAQAAGRDPVLALMPMPGDVDVVLASELMEAARAIERGFVSPDKTLLIASTHRVFAMTEKIALADGRVDSAALFDACREAARQFIAFDMAALADAAGSVLSAVLFGALAGASALPFPRSAFEAAIRRAGVGVERSIAAFAAGFEAARSGEAVDPTVQRGASGSDRASPRVPPLSGELAQEYSGEARSVVAAGIERLIDYQDQAYARSFLARLTRFRKLEQQHEDRAGALIAEVARQLALAMAYEDVIRVAALKIRPSRFAKVRQEVQIEPGQVLEISEYFHPRVEEIADMLPAGLGRWLLRTAWARHIVERLTRRGKTVKTTSIGGFILLYALARLKPLRRKSFRFAQEQTAIEAWLDLVTQAAAADYALAVEVARARSLVKGYGDTLERGRAKFVKICALVPQMAGRENAAAVLGRLTKAALQDEHGRALDKAIAEVEPASDSVAAIAGRPMAEMRVGT